MNAKSNSENRIGIWMDHQLAHFVYRNGDGEFVTETIQAEPKRGRNASGKDESENENKKHNRINESLKAYYKSLQKKLNGFDHILIVGPTTAGAEFHHHLQKVRSFTGKRIAEEKAPIMTERQLVAFMKKKLGKPMDIFRDDEVIGTLSRKN